MELQNKLQKKINEECDYADKHGSSKFSVSYEGFGWDQDEYNHRNEIASAIRNRGYKVEISTSHGVTDIRTYKKVELS